MGDEGNRGLWISAIIVIALIVLGYIWWTGSANDEAPAAAAPAAASPDAPATGTTDTTAPKN